MARATPRMWVPMFVRPVWRPQSPEEAYQIVDENLWALLISNGDDGPFVTNLPLMLDRSRGPHGTLLGHISRANEHSKVLFESTTPVLAVFEGPYSYVTPSWYPQRDMPGTYYYTAVHCYGRVRPQNDADLERTLKVLNDRMEQPIPGGWRIDEVPRSEITRRLPSIAGFEIEIERLEAKFKLGQDEPKKDALAVATRLLASKEPEQRKLGVLTRRANINRVE
jgi:transcriptional regulator